MTVKCIKMASYKELAKALSEIQAVEENYDVRVKVTFKCAYEPETKLAQKRLRELQKIAERKQKQFEDILERAYIDKEEKSDEVETNE